MKSKCEIRLRPLKKTEGIGYRVSVFEGNRFLDYKDFTNKKKAQKYAKVKCRWLKKAN